jgi:C-terminal processing protease CtpA/Prc
MRFKKRFPILKAAAFALAAFALAASAASAARAQPPPSSAERDRARDMLRHAQEDIKKEYYDPAFHGIDLDAHFNAADEKLKKATSLGQLFGVIAQALAEFDDSHLFFVPPSRSARYDYGWRMRMIGDKCFVTAVKPDSDAEKKGLRPGDEIISIDGREPTRDNHWKMQYFYYALRPQPAVRFVVAKPGGERAQYDVLTKVTEGKRIQDLTVSGGNGVDLINLIRDEENAASENRDRYIEAGEDLFIWKMNEFDLEPTQVDDMMGKARKHKAFILDLRGNGGGAETTLLRLLSNVFDHEVKLGDITRRKETKPLVAKGRGDSAFKGDLVVLIDSQSGSAAELFARVIQLEKRGRVVGDRSAGAVMRSRLHPHSAGVDVVTEYGVSVTDADIVMTDGKSLEHVGVTPDAVMLPGGADMAAGRDPVLAYAASLVGVKLDADKAGALFPTRWPKN